MAANYKPQARRTYSRRAKSNPRIRELERGTPGGKNPGKDAAHGLRPGPRSTLNVYLSHHLWVAVSTLGSLWRSPLSTLLTSSVIAIALALPAGLYVMLQNVQQLSSSWENSSQISVFLKSGQTESQLRTVREQLQAWPEIQAVHYISAEQALAEFRQSSGFGEALQILDQNPLPEMFVIQPAIQLSDSRRLQELQSRLDSLPQVDQTLLDMQWVLRLSAIIDTGKRMVFILGALLFIAILLVIGNTIRLTIFNKRQEIVVTKLIGATNQFIRRPFLYTGFWYGVFGALLAWLLVTVLLALLKGPIDDLSLLYESQFSLNTMGVTLSGSLFAVGILLGLLGSWLAVSRHLKAIEPK
ncbi:MAG: permease-like cell division protein FtsX [Gammaproteobacteria bacterium]|jgi:cell division transport system permease protein|nr:permease-like cell division protein FtsX [Gammaproteobacteria bacterium]